MVIVSSRVHVCAIAVALILALPANPAQADCCIIPGEPRPALTEFEGKVTHVNESTGTINLQESGTGRNVPFVVEPKDRLRDFHPGTAVKGLDAKDGRFNYEIIHKK